MGLDRTILFGLATNGAWERLVRALPVGERWARRAAARYVAGDTAAQALELARTLDERGVLTSVDFFGELVQDNSTADRVTEEYLRLADELPGTPDGTWLAVDLSHLGLDLDRGACAERLTTIAQRLPRGRRIQVGAEDFDRADAVLDCILDVAAHGHADRIGSTLQANLHRSAEDLDRLVDAGVHVRLVKGAYVEPPARALPFGEPTDVAYVRLAHRLADAEADFALATHDTVLREALLVALGPRPVEQLYGVRPETLDELVTRGIPIRVYAPYGQDWFRYWMRRLAESRGA